jgi:hypothetical protein
MGLQKSKSVEAGLELSKLVSKLEAGNQIPDKSGPSAKLPGRTGFGPGLCKKLTRASSIQGEHRQP